MPCPYRKALHTKGLSNLVTCPPIITVVGVLLQHKSFREITVLITDLRLEPTFLNSTERLSSNTAQATVMEGTVA